MQAQDRRTDGFLTRLKRDTRGNTLAIVGAALVPLAAMIGSGLDMSRAYMAKTRLQSACDAASLAARRVMTDDQMTDAVRAEAARFFTFNFPQGLYNSEAYELTVTRPQAGSVAITTSTRIPTTIMSMFGIGSLPLNVSCEASLNFVNTDVMLVLDVTGSMGNNLSGTQKIVSLRDAVMALYDELAPVQQQLESNGLRLRYGVVPYSTTVHVGPALLEVGAAYLSDSVAYQSRRALYDTPRYVAGTPTVTSTEYEYYNGSSGAGSPTPTTFTRTSSQCNSWGNSSAVNGGGPAPTPTTRTTYNNNVANDWGWPGAHATTTSNRSCRRTRTVSTTEYTTRFAFTRWYYEEGVEFDTSTFKSQSAVRVLANTGGTVETAGRYTIQQLEGLVEHVTTTPSTTAPTYTTMTWNGCIEERATVSSINSSSGFNLPEAAYDLNINLIPNDANTRWRPQWPAIVYSRTTGTTETTSGSSMSSAPCPAQVERLQAWNRTEMQNYIDSLLPVGNTYHDIGMIWGARLISNTGPFGDSPDTFNGMPVNRHIIFMTDGQMEPSASVYSAYGIENLDQRITGTTGTGNLTNNHLQRFRMICNAAKGMNVSVWVIAFGTSLSNDMRNCASNASQASTSGNRDQLIARFRQIGNQIGALRLTQ
ncbi:MAG: TadE/TadG family protein [Sphingomonas sp.]|nr:TadE/TadG family protein [Sphingomonas sp.]